ncbi:MAG TPA: nucleotide sugar dehydrogenase [Magnetospirillum sp.]|jgi:UDP-N-acetyl-D-glucosamine dehydrogenase|nr:nucleotide sugar dehydrogenase [Magnetospirillum sp.]
MTAIDPVRLLSQVEHRIKTRSAIVGVIGMGYVGLPLARIFARKGFQVRGFDIDPDKVEKLNAGQSYIHHIPGQSIAELVATGHFEATTDFAALGACDAVLICVPTPLTRQRQPDLSYVVATTEAILPHLRAGHLVVLESTTYPGTTDEIMRPILERSGLVSGQDFFLGFSPEREDPGNTSFETATIPKIVGGQGQAALRLACLLYDQVVPRTIPVSSCATAEAVKLTENIFRSVNIALVNELKVVYERMGIDVWEVIEAAKSKPFGFMPFYPGPGLGGHCIPIDPFYLTWKAREYDLSTRFIELAGEINTAMPGHVVDRLALALDQHFRKSLNGARILVLGMAYKKNVDDIRESPAIRIIHMLETRGAVTSYHDPLVPEIHRTREHPELAGRRSVALSPETLAGFDAAVIVTDHDAVDYAALVRHSKLVVDTRNATRAVRAEGAVVVKA